MKPKQHLEGGDDEGDGDGDAVIEKEPVLAH